METFNIMRLDQEEVERLNKLTNYKLYDSNTNPDTLLSKAACALNIEGDEGKASDLIDKAKEDFDQEIIPANFRILQQMLGAIEINGYSKKEYE